MGHYRSEMLGDFEREEQFEKDRHNRIVETLQAAIEADGIEHVLARIIEDMDRPCRYKR